MPAHTARNRWKVNTTMTTASQATSTELELLQEILSIDSTWGHEKRLAEFLGDQLRRAGVEDVALIESMPGRPSVAGRLRGTGGGKSLILNGHLDIYEVSPDWQRDPFTSVVEDGLVYGAGIADMKAATCAGLAALKRIAASTDRPRGDIIFQGVSCHFEGGAGTRSLLDAGYTADAAICGEPTDNTLGIVHRGAAYLKITTFGKQAHTAGKQHGLNAIETMEPILAALRRFENEMPYTEHPDLPGGPILNIGTIRGGTKHNQVPDRCEITLDIRLLPSQDPYDVKRQAEHLITRLHDEVDDRIKATVEFSEHWLSGPRFPYEIAKDADIVQTAAKAVADAGYAQPKFQGIQFWTDMVVMNDFGIPAVNVGPGTPPYSWADEWVEQTKFAEIVDVYENAARSWCR